MAIQKINIAMVDLVAEASASKPSPKINHVDFMSLSAHNPTVVKDKIERLTAKIARIKAKPKTEARTRRMAVTKKRIGELKVLLKEAIKAEKAKPKGDAKLAKKGKAALESKKGKTAAKPAAKTKSGGTDEKRDRLVSKLKAAEKEHADAKATYVKNSIPESRAYEKIQKARNLLDQHEGKELLKEAEAGGKYKFHHTHSAKDILKHMPIEKIRKESDKISKLAHKAAEKAWGEGSRGKTEAQLDKDRTASRLLSNKSGALRSALNLHKKNERTKADRDPVVKKLNATIDKARGLLGMQIRKRRGAPNERLIKGYQDKIKKAEADLAAHLAKKKK